MSNYIDRVCNMTDKELERETNKVIRNGDKEKAKIIRLVAMIRLSIRECLNHE